jgi:hypothetical protein
VIASQESPPPRFIAGADAFALAEQKVAALQEAINAYRDLSTSLASTMSTPPGTGASSPCAQLR